MNESGAVVLLSGGMDSAVCLSLAVRKHGAEDVYGVSFRYGQKHEKEMGAAEALCKHYGVPLESVSLNPHLFEGSGSTLIDRRMPVPKTTYEELLKAQGPSSTYVAFRNGNLLSGAASIAIREKKGEIFAGMHAEDARNWAYPDCTPEFLGAMASAIWVGSYMKVRLITPLMFLTKADVVRLGRTHGTPFRLTWSCYEGMEKPCRECPTCISREKAFEEAGLTDPLLADKE